MAEKELAQVMDPEGKIVDPEAVKELSDELILKMYRLMVFTRLWTKKALSLQRQGRMGTVASVKGQEASNIGMGLALSPGDWFCPSFREMGTQITLGYKPAQILKYWGGDEKGAAPPEGVNMLPVCITVGSHVLHAAGIAMAAKIRGEKVAVLSSSGDGSTSQGDFHEGLTFAGVYQLPYVAAIQNNHWAISTPVEKQTASETIAQKAIAYGIDQARVDGNDVFAVYVTVKRLLDRARSENKPALVELVTYRMDDHTTSDDATRYRTEEMIAPWREKDPIDRLRKFLIAEKGWNDDKENELIEECNQEVEETVGDFEGGPQPEPEQIFDHMYSEEPWRLREEREELRRYIGD